MKYTFSSPVGWIEIGYSNTHITSVRIVDSSAASNDSPNEIALNCESQLMQYFKGERKSFDLPLMQSGTPFQERVWSELEKIPYGETISYKELAVRVGSERASRAVGSANGKNNICIIVPCHRVIESGGGLGGYAYGVEVKKKLVEMEIGFFNTK